MTGLRTLSVAWLTVLVLAIAAVAAPPAPTKSHPVPVTITERGGKIRTAKLVAQNAFEPREANPVMKFDTETGTVEVLVDNLVSISDVKAPKGKKANALFSFKDKSQKRLQFGFCQECLWLENQDGSKEKVDVRRLVRLEVHPLNY